MERVQEIYPIYGPSMYVGNPLPPSQVWYDCTLTPTSKCRTYQQKMGGSGSIGYKKGLPAHVLSQVEANLWNPPQPPSRGRPGTVGTPKRVHPSDSKPGPRSGPSSGRLQVARQHPSSRWVWMVCCACSAPEELAVFVLLSSMVFLEKTARSKR